MDKEERYTLEILNRIEENGRVTQPEIANHLGISIGLANSFIKRIARKGEELGSYLQLSIIIGWVIRGKGDSNSAVS